MGILSLIAKGVVIPFASRRASDPALLYYGCAVMALSLFALAGLLKWLLTRNFRAKGSVCCMCDVCRCIFGHRIRCDARAVCSFNITRQSSNRQFIGK